MYVFLGILYAPEDEKRVLEKSKIGLQGAANNYQWALLRGLSQNLGQQIPVINSVPMGTFPRHCKILLEKSSVVETPVAQIRSNGYLNLPVIKQLQRQNAAYRSLKKLICGSSEPVTVIGYHLYAPHLRALYRLKKKFKNFQYILVVTDLPGIYGVESANPLLRQIRRAMGRKELALAQAADGYVILTEQMAQVLGIENKPYTVIEGIYNAPKTDADPIPCADVPVILYTGSLNKEQGLDILLEAFHMLPPGSVQLHLAGGGPDVKTVEQACRENPNIRYLGYLSKQEIDVLQRSAAVLVNPRSDEKNYTKYSFPSKTIEYLSTGVPVVMNKLPGIPEDYDEHLFYTERSDAQSLAETLQKVLDIDAQTLAEHGATAKAFIEHKKSATAQTKKIIALEKLL